MRRVLHLVGALEDNGGILSTIRGVASHGEAMGWEHLTWMRRGFVQVRSPRLEVVESRFALGESSSHLRLLISAACAWPGLRRWVRRRSIDVVHGHSRGALLLSSWMARSGWPSVFTNHAYARRTEMYRRVADTPGLTTILLTPNQARHYGMGGVAGVELVSECGADRFFEVPLGEPGTSWGGQVRLVGVGNLVRWKRWDLLVEAVALLPAELRRRVRATVWGPVPDDADARLFAGELAGLVAARGLKGQVDFPGATGDIEGVLAGSDLFVLPSTNEPCSVALIEAMAMGLPAVVSASGGNVDIVRDGVTGLLFRPGDAGDLSRRLEDVLRGRARMAGGAEIRQSVAWRCARAVAARHGEVYGRLVRARAHG